MSSSPSHHRLHQSSSHYRNSISPPSTCSDDDSSHSQPNDLTLNRKHHNQTFPSYPNFYSPPSHHSSLGQSQHSSQTSPYIATNDCRIIEYRGARVAAFLCSNKNPCEYLLCLPQAFELFLKHLVGGLHTVYTKLKRLDIVPIVCNVEQVRILRGLGAIQPGVNRCKLLATKDFDVLYKDCTTASRPGRPPKRSPVAGMVSPVPTTIAATVPTQQPNSVPYLGFPPTSKKLRYADDADFANESLDIKHQISSNGSNSNPAATAAAAMLAANGYSAAFPFLQHFNNAAPTPQQQQQLVAAAAALGLPGLPSNRFPNASPPPGLASVNTIQNNTSNTSINNRENKNSSNTNNINNSNNNNNNNSNSNNINSNSSNNNNNNNNSNSNNNNNNIGNSDLGASDFNPTAAYLWLLSQQQQHQQASSALNLSSRNSITNHGTANNVNNKTNRDSLHPANEHDETTDDDDEDDVESNNSSNNSDNPVSSTGFQVNGTRNGNENGTGNHNRSSVSPIPPPAPASVSSISSQNHHGLPTSTALQSQPEHCLETLLRNIEGLLAIAAHNARQQQSQLQLQKAELRAELGSQIEREKEIRETLEKQLNEEQKIRAIYQKRFKKERRFRRKIEQELQQVQKVRQPSSGHQQPNSQSQQQQQDRTDAQREREQQQCIPVSKSPPTTNSSQIKEQSSIEVMSE